MQGALKIISLLLTYPNPDLMSEMPDIRAAIGIASGLGAGEHRLLDVLAADLCESDIYDAQERYVFLFDRTRSLSLHLFEHVHGESRDRGQAMVDLLSMYEADGFSIGAKELPDYLPLFLEYLSTKPDAAAAELLGQTAHILAAIGERLKKRSSVYAHAFDVLCAIASQKPDEKLLDGLLAVAEDDPDDLAALDAIWEEEAIAFGGNAGENACGPDRLQRQMRAHSRKPDTHPATSA